MKKNVVFLFCAMISLNLFAQSELPTEYPTVDKVKVKMDFPKEGRSGNSGKGFSANLEKLPNGIKKVALVSFFVFDPGLTKTWTTSSPSYTTTYTKKRSTGGLSADICIGALDKAYKPLISTFKDYGMDLLFPDEFLTSEDQKTFYNNFKVQHDGLDNFLNKMGSGNHDVMYGTPEGFIVTDIVKEPYANYTKSGMFAVKKTVVADNQVFLFDKDLKMTESLGFELCTKLNVDAVLVSYMTVWAKNDKEIRLENVRLVMFGPNPTMPENGKSKYGLIPHIKGLFYVGLSVNPEMALYKYNKKKPETQNFDFTGFDIIYTAMAKTMGEYIKEETKKK